MEHLFFRMEKVGGMMIVDGDGSSKGSSGESGGKKTLVEVGDIN